jgi:hypothetical protein
LIYANLPIFIRSPIVPDICMGWIGGRIDRHGASAR